MIRIIEMKMARELLWRRLVDEAAVSLLLGLGEKFNRHGVSSKVRILLANSKWCNFNTMTFRRVALLFPLASQGQVGYSHPPITATDTMM